MYFLHIPHVVTELYTKNDIAYCQQEKSLYSRIIIFAFFVCYIFRRAKLFGASMIRTAILFTDWAQTCWNSHRYRIGHWWFPLNKCMKSVVFRVKHWNPDISRSGLHDLHTDCMLAVRNWCGKHEIGNKHLNWQPSQTSSKDDELRYSMTFSQRSFVIWVPCGRMMFNRDDSSILL